MREVRSERRGGTQCCFVPTQTAEHYLLLEQKASKAD